MLLFVAILVVASGSSALASPAERSSSVLDKTQRKQFWISLRNAINGLVPQVLIALMAALGFTNSIN